MAASSDDSQATRLLAKFMESDAEQSLRESLASEQSIDSFKPNVVPPPCYHTNGLPLLQNESQGPSNRDGYELQEGSQKENVKSSDGWLLGSKTATKGMNSITSPLQPTKSPIIHKGSYSQYKSDQEKEAFKSPLPSTRNRAASQDSFIGPESDPATAYISKSKHFQMPLSQLDNSTEDSQDNIGTILVEATPDPGDDSHNQEYEEDEEMTYAQPRDHVFEDEDVVDVADASQASSHSDALAFWTTEATRTTDYADEATQPDTQPETQSTQPEDNSQPGLDAEWDNLVKLAGVKLAVSREKRGRYIDELRKKVGQQGNSEYSTSDPAHMEDLAATQVATQVETQLDDETAHSRQPRRQLPAPRCRPEMDIAPTIDNSEPTQVMVDEAFQSNRRRQLPAPKRKAISLAPEVADSKPPNNANATPETAPTDQVNNEASSVPDHQQDQATDIVSDSEAARLMPLDPLTSDEGEGEIPLAAKAGGSGKRKMKKETSAHRMPPPSTALPQIRAGAKGKGKGRAVDTPAPEKTKTRRSATGKKAASSSRGKEVEVVPSSVPNETPQPKKATRSKASQKSSTKRRGAGSSAKRRRTGYANDDSPVEEKSAKEEDFLTELGFEDDYAETSSLKRKRPTRGTHDVVVTSGSGVKPSQISRGRNPKSVQADVQVFALSKADGHYFAGRLQHRDTSGNCFVEFMDKSTALLQLDQIRRLDLRLGDEVLWEEEIVGWSITGLHLESKGQLQVTTELYGTRATHGLEEIRIPTCSVMSRWGDRKFNPASATILSLPIRDDGSVKPSTSAVKLTVEKPRPTHFLREVAIIGTHINEQVLRDLSTTGALNTSQWTDVISFGEHNEGRRWRLLKEECGKVDSSDLEGITRIFMVANAPYATPKYLMALALGVPCVSLSWLTEMASEGSIKDWSQYLLPQGYSEYLGLRTSQLVDMDWGNSPDHIARIIDNPAPAKLFKGLNILCVTEDGDYIMNSTTSLLPAIILAMGAELVEVVDHIDDKSEFICLTEKSMFVTPEKVEKLRREGKEIKSLEFHLVIYLKRGLGEAQTYKGLKARTWGWVKESLIASRLLPDSLDMLTDAMEL